MRLPFGIVGSMRMLMMFVVDVRVLVVDGFMDVPMHMTLCEMQP